MHQTLLACFQTDPERAMILLKEHYAPRVLYLNYWGGYYKKIMYIEGLEDVFVKKLISPAQITPHSILSHLERIALLCKDRLSQQRVSLLNDRHPHMYFPLNNFNPKTILKSIIDNTSLMSFLSPLDVEFSTGELEEAYPYSSSCTTKIIHWLKEKKTLNTKKVGKKFPTENYYYVKWDQDHPVKNIIMEDTAYFNAIKNR